MRSEIILAGGIVAMAVVSVRYFESRETQAPSPEQLQAAAPVKEPEAEARAVYSATDGWREEVRVKAARDHQFYIEADVNRRTSHFLIDTGASYVAMRDSDARNAGVYTNSSDFNFAVRTANGETMAAFVTLEEMEIEGILIKGVKAFILPDDQLSVNLLGMSFLSRLESVEARSGELVLRG